MSEKIIFNSAETIKDNFERKKKEAIKAFIFLFLLILISIPISSLLGSSSLSINDVLDVYANKILGKNILGIKSSDVTILWNIRLPRIILAIAVGGGLSISGCAMQALTRNVLSEPYTLGISSGASLFAAISIAYFSSKGISIFAFIGAISSLFLVYNISSSYSTSSTKLVLAGIGVSTICRAINSLIMTTVPSKGIMTSIVFWTMGSLGSAKWSNITLPLVIFILGMILLYSMGESLNLMTMGDETAKTLGLSIKNFKKMLIIVTSIITGVMVSVSGCIGFVGLVVPHIMRRIVGSDHKKLIPLSGLAGGLLLVWSDTIARTILAPKELSIGIITALIGGPFFLRLLVTKEI